MDTFSKETLHTSLESVLFTLIAVLPLNLYIILYYLKQKYILNKNLFTLKLTHEREGFYSKSSFFYIYLTKNIYYEIKIY